MEAIRSAFLERKMGPKVALLLVTFVVLAEMCVLYRTSHVRIPRSLEEYKDHGDLLTDERNWISTLFLFLGLPTAVFFSLFSLNLFCWEMRVILFTVKPETKLYSLKFKNKINRFFTRYASESYTQWKKIQGWGGQFHTNQCNILSKASLDHWDAGHASLTWHVYPSLSPDPSILMNASTVSHARLSGSTTSLYYTLSLTLVEGVKKVWERKGREEDSPFSLYASFPSPFWTFHACLVQASQ